MRRTYKPYLIVPILIGGLWFSAAILSSKVYALSDSSTDPTASSTTTQPSTTTTDTTTEPSSTSTTTALPATTAASDDTTPTAAIPATSSTGPTTSITPLDPAATNAATVDNTVQSGAASGDAMVSKNAQAGDATSGSSSASATVVNTIQSASAATSDPNGFEVSTSAVNGTSNGDIYLDPTQLEGQGSSSAPAENSSLNSGTIDNTIDLASTSGDATVENNGVAGNATTGNADADAQIINVINSTIGDSQGWIETLNIYGTLNGDIVLPAGVISALLDPSTTNGAADVEANANNITNVTNNVNLLASSGTATVSNNGTAGNATTGNASTNLENYNLINNDIVGGNMLLVFVNVAGNWVGLLFGAPAGTATAALGGNIQQDSVIPAVQTVNATNIETVANNVNVRAVSGNALVTYNGQAGNATSGNAAASATIVNLLGDQISLSGWLGVLVINVFGSWNGSLVIAPPITNTSANILSTPQVTLLSSVGNKLSTSIFHKKYCGHLRSATQTGTTTTTTPANPQAPSAATAVKHTTFASLAPNGVKLLHKNSNVIGEVTVAIGVVIAVAGAGAMGLSRRLARR